MFKIIWDVYEMTVKHTIEKTNFNKYYFMPWTIQIIWCHHLEKIYSHGEVASSCTPINQDVIITLQNMIHSWMLDHFKITQDK